MERVPLTAAAGSYRALDAGLIIQTARALSARVTARFPDSGLSGVCEELCAEAERAEETCRWLAMPIGWLRAGVAACILVMLAIVAATLFAVNAEVTAFSSLADLFQGIDAVMNEIILVSVAIFFLLGLENRIKSARALKGIHVLRSLAHIIDMHQLTKDPERLAPDYVVRDPSSEAVATPPRAMTRFELSRYLDYCSEMLSILAKVAALYVQDLRDPTTLAAVNEVEGLTTGLSRKIWQKIAIIERLPTR